MTLSMTLNPRSDLRRMPLRSIRRLDNSRVNINIFAYHILILVSLSPIYIFEGSVVECWTCDPGVTGSSLT